MEEAPDRKHWLCFKAWLHLSQATFLISTKSNSFILIISSFYCQHLITAHCAFTKFQQHETQDILANNHCYLKQNCFDNDDVYVGEGVYQDIILITLLQRCLSRYYFDNIITAQTQFWQWWCLCGCVCLLRYYFDNITTVQLPGSFEIRWVREYLVNVVWN